MSAREEISQRRMQRRMQRRAGSARAVALRDALEQRLERGNRTPACAEHNDTMRRAFQTSLKVFNHNINEGVSPSGTS